jgi:hypothetical protein
MMNQKRVILALAIGLIGTGPALSQGPSANKPEQRSSSSATQAQVGSQQADYSEPMRRLLEAAQRLRDATHAMAAQKDGPQRNQAIRQTNEALFDTQQAMLELPIELRNASGSAPDWDKSMDRLKQAAQKLRDAAQAMAEQKAGPDRNAAIKQTNDALLETQQAMIDLLPDVRSATTGSGETNSGSGAGGTKN